MFNLLFTGVCPIKIESRPPSSKSRATRWRWSGELSSVSCATGGPKAKLINARIIIQPLQRALATFAKTLNCKQPIIGQFDPPLFKFALPPPTQLDSPSLLFSSLNAINVSYYWHHVCSRRACIVGGSISMHPKSKR